MRLMCIEMVEAGEDQWSFMVPLACPTPKAESRVTRNKNHMIYGEISTTFPNLAKQKQCNFFFNSEGLTLTARPS